MTMKHSNQTVREIFSSQVAMVYSLFIDNFKLPPEIVQTVVEGELSHYVFYFPSVTSEDVILDCDVAVSKWFPDMHVSIQPCISPIEQLKELHILPESLNNENTDQYLRNAAISNVWYYIFQDDNEEWDLDLSEQAILINTDNIICIAMLMYDLYKQLANSDNNSSKILKAASFSLYRKDIFSYSIFAGTICRYLQSVYSAYKMTVYDLWILNKDKQGGSNFSVKQTLRSVEDLLGDGAWDIPHGAIPTVFPDFHLT